MREIIAIIATNTEQNYRDFLHSRNLNPKMFRMVTKVRDLEGISKDTPIIITYGAPSEVRRMALYRFDSVRLMDLRCEDE